MNEQNCSKFHEMVLRFIARRILKEGDLGILADYYMQVNGLNRMDIDVTTPGSDYTGIVGRFAAYKFGTVK